MPLWSTGIQTGTRAAQPTPNAKQAGTLYWVTDEEVLERWSGSAWTAYSTEPVTAGVEAGTSFPGSPATNLRYFRTDLGMEFYWDGTRWVSVTVHQIQGQAWDLVASGYFNAFAAFDVAGLDVYLVNAYLALAVQTTHDATNDWTIRFEKVNVASSGGVWTQLTTVESSAVAAGLNNFQGTTVNLANVMDVSATPAFLMYAVRNGSAGTLRAAVTVRYRFIAT